LTFIKPPKRPGIPKTADTSPHNYHLDIIFAEGGGPDGVFHQVVVYLHLAVIQE
jgi:hypothetical protein